MKFLIPVLLLSMSYVEAAPNPKATGSGNVKYRRAKQLDFEKLLIEGNLNRPEMSVVTGESADDINGLLRLREDFVDQITLDAGENL